MSEAVTDSSHLTLLSRLAAYNLADWLRYIEQLNTKPIVMGLDRVQSIIERAQLKPSFPIITVAGTNGKGSTCAMLEAIYTRAGYRVGCYTSPHLLRYNERVRINRDEVEDKSLCAAFYAIEHARLSADSPVALTYFEMGTLAAMWHFMRAEIDVAVLEIGLGGRLDAVNAFDPSCAIVTTVDLDHQDFLGDTREKIGFEKAGVYRTSTPAICGDSHPPDSLVDYAQQIQANLLCIHQDFGYRLSEQGWQYLSRERAVYNLPIPILQGAFQLDNAACAVTAIEAMQQNLPVTSAAIASALTEVQLAGRFQTLLKNPLVIVDVAHNPHAAVALANHLRSYKNNKIKAGTSHLGKTFAVFAMLSDKDIAGVVEAVNSEIDTWYVANIHHGRGALASDVAHVISTVNATARIHTFDLVDEAFTQARADIQSCMDVCENDKIIVFGSFFTVASVMQLLQATSTTQKVTL